MTSRVAPTLPGVSFERRETRQLHVGDVAVGAGAPVSVQSMTDEFEIRNWKVATRQGDCTFQSKIGEWPHQTPMGGLLIRDVAGNLFHIPKPRELDADSQKILWAFID